MGDVIGSGPTVPDYATFEECMQTLRDYKILDTFPASCRKHLEKGAAKEIPETPKAGDAMFKNSIMEIVASNATAANAAIVEAEKQGYNTMLFSTEFEGCNAYSFFQKLEEKKYGKHNVLHLRDGPTGTNVADIMVVLVRKID